MPKPGNIPWNKGLTKADPRVAKYVHPERSALDRFLEKVSKSESCWLWIAHCDHEGYGRLWLNGTMGYAHCFSYQTLIGQIP